METQVSYNTACVCVSSIYVIDTGSTGSQGESGDCLSTLYPYSDAGCADLPIALLCDHERRRRERERLLDTEIRSNPAAPVETSDTRAVMQAGTARCNVTHAQPRAITLPIIDRGCLVRRMLK
jgi:hypothetical protein